MEGYDKNYGEVLPSGTLDGNSRRKNPFPTAPPPDVYKYIWLSFNKLPEHEKAKANIKIRSSAAYDDTAGLSNKHISGFNSDKNKNIREIKSYEEWLDVFTRAEKLPIYWSYTQWAFLDRFKLPRHGDDVDTMSRSRSRSRYGSDGGSRRSLQKSRFLKRKSRKYKSIKKSKKRSFRNRGRH